MTFEKSSSRTLHTICGSQLIALSLIVDGRVSMLLMFSAQPSKIISLSDRRQWGGSRTLWAINRFQCIMERHHVLSVCKRLDCFCSLAQPVVLHVPKPVLDCLTNIDVPCTGVDFPQQASLFLHHLHQSSLGNWKIDVLR